MRIVLWHGWGLEGSGSNVYTARVAERYREQGHAVLLLCQEPHPRRVAAVDAFGDVGPGGVSALQETGAAGGSGRLILLRPQIGALLPVFVVDEYEGFQVRRFTDLTDDELEGYLARNEAALREAVAWHGADVVVAGHAVPGPAVARRALESVRYIAKVHGSDIEYAVRPDRRYRDLARFGLEG
ncbi:MAG: hypothetical protein M3245_04610, partial [Actinomycetota bacterium]|nr:hypothetical protein [Actinomycetota bacterium]